MTNFKLLPADSASLAPTWTTKRWFNHPGQPQLSDYRGTVVVVHAFQMLCPACVIHGIPQAQRIASTFSPDDVTVLGLHTVFEHHDAMTPTSLKAFLSEYRVGFPVGIDAPLQGSRVPATMTKYGLRGTPTLLLIDRAGRLRLHAFGRADDMAIGAAIALLIGEGVSAHEVGSGSRPPDGLNEGCSTHT